MTQSPYAQPAGGYYPPPKKSHTLRNVLLIILGLFILLIGGCFAVTAAFVNEVDNAIDEQEQEDAQPGGPDNPLEVTPGEPFEVSGFNYQAGWTLAANDLGFAEVGGLKYENTRDDTDGAIVEIKLWNGNEVLASIDCTSDQAAVDTIVPLTCLGADEMPASYDRVTINDTF